MTSTIVAGAFQDNHERPLQGARDIIIVYDVADKESFNDVKDRMGEIDKHVSDGVNKLLVENQCDLTSQEEELCPQMKRRRSRIP